MNQRSFSLGLLILCLGLSPAVAENFGGPLVLAADGYLSVPVGANANYFQLGGGMLGDVHVRWGDLPVSVGATYDYGWLPSAEPGYFLTIQGFGGVGQFVWPINPTFALSSRVATGWFLAVSNDSRSSQGGNPWFQLGLGLDWRMGTDWVLTGSGEIRDRMGLVNDAVVLLSVKYQPSWLGQPAGPSGPILQSPSARPGFQPLEHKNQGLQLIAYRTEPVVPTMLKWYETHGWGQVIVHNYDGAALENWSLTVEGKGFLNGVREVKVAKRLGPGEEVTVDIVAPLSDKLLLLTQATELNVTVTASVAKKDARTATLPVQVRSRNTIAWDDSRRLAAFISSRDPGAFSLAKSAVKAASSSWNPSLSPEFQTAVVLFSALKTSSLSLRSDPATPDLVQFPIETLTSRTGGLVDLTVLWCSLFEAGGLESAVIKVGDQRFPAFSVAGKGSDVRALWGSEDDYLVRDGKAWVAIDPTPGLATFSQAWKSAAAKIKALALGSAVLSVREAWQAVPPVVLPGMAAPANAKASNTAAADLDAFVQGEFRPRADQILADKKAASPSLAPQFDNKMGVLYARYGFFDQAAEVFKALREQNYRPALVNLAHVLLLSNQPKAAIESYQSALKLQSDDRSSLVGLVLAYQALGDQGAWKTATASLSKVDPGLAAGLGPYKARSSVVRPEQLVWKE